MTSAGGMWRARRWRGVVAAWMLALGAIGLAPLPALGQPQSLRVEPPSWFQIDGNTLRVTASIGPHGARLSAKDDCDSLIRHADNALYEAKESGRNRTVVG